MYLDEGNLYGWAMSQNLPVGGGFKRIEDVLKIDDDFIKSYNGNGNIRLFLEVDIECPKNYITYIAVCRFYQKE